MYLNALETFARTYWKVISVAFVVCAGGWELYQHLSEGLSSRSSAALFAVRVQVFDPSGEPLAGSRVRASAGNEPQALPDGWWEVEVPAAKRPIDGKVTITASHPDWRSASKEIVLRKEPNPSIRLDLERVSTSLRGRVVDINRRPVPGAQVWSVDETGGEEDRVKADEEGGYRLDVPLASTRLVRIRATFGDQGAESDSICRAGAQSCDVELPFSLP